MECEYTPTQLYKILIIEEQIDRLKIYNLFNAELNNFIFDMYGDDDIIFKLTL